VVVAGAVRPGAVLVRLPVPRCLWQMGTAKPGAAIVGLIGHRPSWLPYVGATAPEGGRRLFGCVGSEEVGDEHLCSGEVGSQVSCSIVWRGRWSMLAEADISRFGRFRIASLEEFPVPTAGAGDGDACGCHDLFGGIVEESMRLSFTVSTPKGNLRSSGSGDEGAVCVFLLLGGIVSESTLLGDW
jgi:hypothetical protein